MADTDEAINIVKNSSPAKKPSPLELFQLQFCRHCTWKCNPSERRMLICVLCWQGDAAYQNVRRLENE